jgi:tetratricopeptide (TPR) repeat protein
MTFFIYVMKSLKNRHILILLFFLFKIQSGYACINEYRTLLSGEISEFSRYGFAPNGHFSDRDYFLTRFHEADSIYRQTKSIEDYSDYGAMLVYDGQYLKALAIFQEIEAKSPNRYTTAANIGTIYELIGKNDLAYNWIQKAIKINPNSHEGSEWIHLKILDAKMKANGDNNYFLNHNILNLDFGNEEKPVSKDEINLDTLYKQLFHQLDERITFVKPKDPIVAQLLFDLGNICAMVKDVEGSLEIYELARKYGFESPLMQKREEYFNSLTWDASMQNFIDDKKRNIIGSKIFFWGIVILFFGGLFYLVKRIIKWRKAK